MRGWVLVRHGPPLCTNQRLQAEPPMTLHAAGSTLMWRTSPDPIIVLEARRPRRRPALPIPSWHHASGRGVRRRHGWCAGCAAWRGAPEGPDAHGVRRYSCAGASRRSGHSFSSSPRCCKPSRSPRRRSSNPSSGCYATDATARSTTPTSTSRNCARPSTAHARRCNQARRDELN
jgi:hypothetical protein